MTVQQISRVVSLSLFSPSNIQVCRTPPPTTCYLESLFFPPLPPGSVSSLLLFGGAFASSLKRYASDLCVEPFLPFSLFFL